VPTSGEKRQLLLFSVEYEACQANNSALSGTEFLGNLFSDTHMRMRKYELAPAYKFSENLSFGLARPIIHVVIIFRKEERAPASATGSTDARILSYS
jgi:hypothetical protein